MVTLIKNGLILNGLGLEYFKGDIAIVDGVISHVEKNINIVADEVIDADGLFVSPGFIDIHNESDHSLSIFANPESESLLEDGVTTIIGGMCGASLAPLIDGSLNSIRKWVDINSVNIGWTNMSDYLKLISQKKLAVNFGTFIGYSTLRRALTNDKLRDLTLDEIEICEQIIVKSIDAGALGLSTGLGYLHGRNIPFRELKDLVRIIAKKNGIYATHLRNEESQVVESVNEAILISNEFKCRTIISHLRPFIGYEKEYREVYDKLNNLDEKNDVFYSMYPASTIINPFYLLLPSWLEKDGLEYMSEQIFDDKIESKLLEHLKKFEFKNMIVTYARNANYLEGKSIEKFSKERELSFEKGLLEIMKLTHLHGAAIYEALNQKMIFEQIINDRALIGSDTPSINKKSLGLRTALGERVHTFKSFIELVVSNNLISLESAIAKITSKPAKILNLKKEGSIEQGKNANLSIFSYFNNKFSINMVIVNGRVAFKEGKVSDIRNGQIIYNNINK